jgi:hypothetical protein
MFKRCVDLEYMAKRNLLKFPYRLGVVTDFVHPLVLRLRNGRVEVARPVLYMYDEMLNGGVLAYRAKDVDAAFLLIWQTDGKRRVYDVCISTRVDAYLPIARLVNMLWIGRGKSYFEIQKAVAGKSVEEIRKTLAA